MSNTKYSVLISIYHKELPFYFYKSIESIINQTVIPDEIVIVKDGPLTPELEQVIDMYVDQYKSLFTIVPLEMNIGLGLALNEGLKICRNELVARMDTDDISFPERCEKQVELFEKNPNLSIVGTWIKEFINNPGDSELVRNVPASHQEIVKFSKTRSPFNHPTVMYRKTSVLSVGGYRNIQRKEDIDLFVRMLLNGSLSLNIQEPLLYFRTNSDNYRRRKTFVNCWSYVKVIHNFWKIGHSSLFDLIFVILSQSLFFIAPTWFLKIVTEKFVRFKSKKIC